MPKRLRDTETWNKKWFRLLPLEYKCFWFYILDNCNLIGIWDVDFELAGFQIGCSIEPTKSRDFFSEQIMEFDDGKKWFLIDFIRFQYGEELKPNSPIHKKVIDLLKATKINNNTLYDTVQDTLLYRVQINKKGEEVEERENKNKYADSVFLKKSEYEKLIERIGEEKTKKCIEKLDAYKDSKGKKYKSDYKAILNWVIDEIEKISVNGSPKNYIPSDPNLQWERNAKPGELEQYWRNMRENGYSKNERGIWTKK